jgi:outer membrane receptor for ferrienterochelin and colicin
MRLPRTWLASLVLAGVLGTLSAPASGAQGVTTGAIAGRVTDANGAPVTGAQVRATSVASGYSSAVLSRDDGRYQIPNLEVGYYRVTARRIGFEPVTRDSQLVSLSQVLPLDLTLTASAAQLGAVVIVAATTTETFTPTNTSVRTIVTDTTISRSPLLSRNLIDLVRIAPQVSTSGAGYSAGGMSNRMNNVQIDGSTERDVFGLGATGQPGSEVNSKSVSLEAVKEFQVLLAPFDVRQGNFGGLLVNAVTKGGTNDLHGTAFYYYRNQDFGKDTVILRGTKFDRAQYGFSLGGPIIRDKLHFFIAPELQSENTPVTGPYFGQPAEQTPVFALREADRLAFEQIMGTIGDDRLGTAGYVNIENPLTNFFGRLDYRVNDTHRLVLRYNHSVGDRLRQQNGRGSTAIVYSGNFHNFNATKMAPVVQLYSIFPSGASNELFIGYNRFRHRRVPESPFPQIQVTGVRLSTNATGTITAGADQFSHKNELDTDTYELTNNFSIPKGNHTFTFGTRNEYVKLRNLFNQSSFGVWTFRYCENTSTITCNPALNGFDSLAAGNANAFRRAIILRDGGNIYFSALQSAWYAQDQWQVNPRVALTLGVRFDVSKFLDDIPYNAAIDSAYGRRTDDIPKTTIQFSPRIGFNWDMTGDRVNQLRGGAGLFVGTPPYVWLENAYVNSGNTITFLNCGATFGAATATAPQFSVDPSNINVCRNGQGSRPIGDVNWLSSSLKFPQPLRFSLGYDRQLPKDLVFSVEGLYSRTLNQFFFVNRNLRGIRFIDRYNRTVYADTIRANGVAVPILPQSVIANGGSARFSTAIDVINQSNDYSYNVTTTLRKRYSNNWEAALAYSFGHSRDVQSFGSSTHISNWQFGRTYSGDQLDPSAGISLFDQTHKISGSATYTLQLAKGWGTDFTMTYQGVSGSPHDYVYNAQSGSGDLNGDGRSGNDLIYVPLNARNTSEIRFSTIPASGSNPAITADSQATAFENFIVNSPCLSRFRGQILPRNSCKLPFSNQVDLAIRQNVPLIRGQRLALQLDITNFGNLLNSSWGQTRQAENSTNSNVPLLTHVGQSSTDPRTAVNIVRFNVNQKEYIVSPFASNFWRYQISARYSF